MRRSKSHVLPLRHQRLYQFRGRHLPGQANALARPLGTITVGTFCGRSSCKQLTERIGQGIGGNIISRNFPGEFAKIITDTPCRPARNR